MAPESVILDEASVPKRQAILDQRCSLFIKIGFAREMFTLKKIHEHGYTENDFLELIKPLFIIVDLDELTHLTAPIPKNDFVKFVDRMKWLRRTQEGMHAIYDSLTRLSKKNLQLSEQHVALAHKLVRYTAPDRLNRKTILDEINESERRQSQRKKEYFDIDEDLKMKLGPLYEYEYFDIDEDLKMKLGPLYEYEEPSIQELRIEAYKLYSDACRSDGRSVIPIYREEGFETAIKEFGDVVKKNHLLRFLNDLNRQEKIEKYLKERLQWFDYVAAAAADPQDSGESSKTIVSDTDESVEAEVSDEHVSRKTRKRAPTDEVPDESSPKRALTGVSKGNKEVPIPEGRVFNQEGLGDGVRLKHEVHDGAE